MEGRGGEDGVAGGGARRLAYAHGASAVPLLGETIGDRWSRTVAEYADREALVCCAQGIRWSYAELDEQVERCARAFLARGVARGDRIGMWGPNSAEWVIVQLAAARVGAILVTINPAFRAAELEYVLRDSGCSLLIHARGFRDVDFGAMLAEFDDAPPTTSLDAGWEALLALGDAAPAAALRARERSVDFDDPVTIHRRRRVSKAVRGGRGRARAAPLLRSLRCRPCRCGPHAP